MSGTRRRPVLWTDEEVKDLRRLHACTPRPKQDTLADLLGRPRGSIAAKLRELGLSKVRGPQQPRPRRRPA